MHNLHEKVLIRCY